MVGEKIEKTVAAINTVSIPHTGANHFTPVLSPPPSQPPYETGAVVATTGTQGHKPQKLHSPPKSHSR